MNLVEVLLAGLIFSLASAGSLQVMAGLGRNLQGAAQAEAAETQLEAELRRSQALVRSGAQQEQASDLACEQPELLISHLLTTPASDPKSAPGEAGSPPIRKVIVLGPGLVRLELSAAEGRWQRQRLFSAAAYGFCPPAEGSLG